MIHMPAFIPRNADEKLRAVLKWGRLRQEQANDVILITKDTVLGFLRRQLERGNWREVLEVLKGKPMTQASRFMLHELRDKIVRRLIFRLGLRPVIAAGLVIVLLPIILAKVSGEVIGWVRNRH
ncbi:hypothetical protein H9Q13_03630 [Pontibacter sp. JH31]|uniref:Uncharacterized protein n=1 Tax=Pontibacter aquaedesilientis TaxID=2766980 RepID=A0ABR7XD78_9BACT|nr:hypothetical protein [Pontibacter aquaedesilientis]MBD1396246.1 hypothetical protein [Pontibacter aquaedesilientis]